ncbi:MAG: peptidylprolyl isomerase [Rhodospirillales bacterium]|nr:peptidylprolyl isomerase [Rhodospirillales bacterium]
MEQKKSNKTLVVVAIVAILVIAGAALFMLSANGVAESEEKGEAPASAEVPEIRPGNPVVGKIGDQDIMRVDVLNFISSLPEQVRQMPIQNLFPMALEQVINNKIVSQRSAEAGLDDDAEVKQLVAQAKQQIVQNVYIERQVKEKMTEERLKKAYDDAVKKMGKVEEVRARHILVEDEAKAKELIGKLDEGASFEELAKENSTGPTGPNGGDLGYFTKESMVPEFADAAFAMKPGEYSKEPVKTQFGWHVIKVEDSRDRPAPEYEAVKPQLQAQVRQEIVAELIEKWQKNAKVKKFDINGDPVKK